jgi:hypothetical protein
MTIAEKPKRKKKTNSLPSYAEINTTITKLRGMIIVVNRKLKDKQSIVSSAKYLEIMDTYAAQIINGRFKHDVNIYETGRLRIELHIPPFHYQILEENINDTTTA